MTYLTISNFHGRRIENRLALAGIVIHHTVAGEISFAGC